MIMNSYKLFINSSDVIPLPKHNLISIVVKIKSLMPPLSTRTKQHRHIVEIRPILLAHASLPFIFWVDAFEIATYPIVIFR